MSKGSYIELAAISKCGRVGLVRRNAPRIQGEDSEPQLMRYWKAHRIGRGYWKFYLADREYN